MNGAIIVETRQIENFAAIVFNHWVFTEWPITIFHGFSNGDFVRKETAHIPGVSYIQLPYTDLSERLYNELLTSLHFWEQVPYEKVLVFQHDSRLLRTGIEEYLEYDFIGAPIAFIPFPRMNGGLSLRTKRKMIEVIQKFPFSGQVNEDMYFCEALMNMGNLPTKKVASTFSVETEYNLSSFGYHAIDRWLSPIQCEAIKNQYNNGS